jgi:hypothetical protein
MWTPAFDPVCDMILSVADTSGVGPAGSGEANGWSLVKVFDLAAVVLGSVVVIQAIGGILSALEVPSIHLNLGAPSGSGLSIHSGDFGIPTYLRIEYGTLWAGVTSGLLLLAALALLAVSRLVWDVPSDDQWAVAPKIVIGILVVSALATVAAAVGTANQIWHTNQLSQSTEALNVAEGIAAMAVTGLASVLSWFALPFIRAGATDQQLLRPGSAGQTSA